MYETGKSFIYWVNELVGKPMIWSSNRFMKKKMNNHKRNKKNKQVSLI